MSGHPPGSGTIAPLAALRPRPSDPVRTRASAPGHGEPEVVRAVARVAARHLRRIAADSLDRIRLP